MDAQINRTIIALLKPYNPKQICVFGSYARGEMRDDSDIDILVDLGMDISMFDLGATFMELQRELNRKIDLVLKDSLSPIFKPYIMKDLKEIYRA